MGRWSRTVAGGCRKRLRLFTQGEDSTRHSAQIALERGRQSAPSSGTSPASEKSSSVICPPPRANRGRGGRGAPGGRPARRCCLGLAAAITMLASSAGPVPPATRRHRANRSWGAGVGETGRLSPLAIVRWLGEIDAHVSGTAPGCVLSWRHCGVGPTTPPWRRRPVDRVVVPTLGVIAHCVVGQAPVDEATLVLSPSGIRVISTSVERAGIGWSVRPIRR